MAALFADMPVGAGQHGGDRAALQPDAGAGQAAAAGLSDAAGRRRAHADRGVLPPARRTRAWRSGWRSCTRTPAEREASAPRYVERLEFEIDTILKMGFPGYFLIVADFINWAKNNGCPVGPGRGSGAGSLVAYALSITDLDPLHYNLLFERFLNPERVSMPDFDIDFCQANRDRVIDYVKEKYGRDAVSQIATFGTMAAKAAMRDVGRVLGMGYGHVDSIAKLVPGAAGQDRTRWRGARRSPIRRRSTRARKRPSSSSARRRRRSGRAAGAGAELEGMTRNVGMHAGGVLIAPGKITDFCPLYQQPGSDSAVSQFDKDDVEAIGLVKFDFWAWPR